MIPLPPFRFTAYISRIGRREQSRGRGTRAGVGRDADTRANTDLDIADAQRLIEAVEDLAPGVDRGFVGEEIVDEDDKFVAADTRNRIGGA